MPYHSHFISDVWHTFFQVPHYILHVYVWSATLCFSCWHVPLCCRSVQWLGTHPDAGCSFLWALPHVLHQTQDIQWTQYVFCLISAHSLLIAFNIGRIQRTPVCFVFCSLFAFCLHYWEDTMNPSVFCFLLTLCFLPSLLGGYNEPVCFVFCSLFAFCLHYWEDTHHTVNPGCLLFIFCWRFALCLRYWPNWEVTRHTVNPVCLLFIFCWRFAFCLHYWPNWEVTCHTVNLVCLLFIFCSLLFAFVIGRLQWTPVSFVFCSLFAFCLHYWEGLSACSKRTPVVAQSYIQTVCWPLFHATFSDHRQVWCELVCRIICF